MSGHQSQPGEQPAHRRRRRGLAGLNGDVTDLAADRHGCLGDELARLDRVRQRSGYHRDPYRGAGPGDHADPVAATAADPAVHAPDTLPSTAPGSMTSACSRSPPMLARRSSAADITPPSSLGWAEVAGTPSTTPTISTWLPATVRTAAKARHPPACELEPVLTPVIPSWPRAALTL